MAYLLSYQGWWKTPELKRSLMSSNRQKSIQNLKFWTVSKNWIREHRCSVFADSFVQCCYCGQTLAATVWHCRLSVTGRIVMRLHLCEKRLSVSSSSVNCDERDSQKRRSYHRVGGFPDMSKNVPSNAAKSASEIPVCRMSWNSLGISILTCWETHLFHLILPSCATLWIITG